ncbi:SGNH/GDSL hydrolase family protein [Cellvibrio fibrivorans]|uniref:Lysophospholipase L1-like esterase n=1 Tax=Cellvibrio fibrivorans TaxID=126350 RepID=A0ABU1UZ50_9GAMM|nr:SGNH/GDSL hydrolase family protein [Cellvibrio fibrivorans]MDR7090445.1 lysophospholipase L1-like esterase [Cellvibrio fibrivorans]
MNLTRFSIALVSLSWISLSAHSAELQQLPTHTSSRVLVTSDEAGNKAYEYSWPAIYFETAFNGDSLTIKFDDDQNNFHLIIDSQTPIAIKKPGKQDYVVPNLTPGKHQVRLEKISETQSSTGRFLGFYSDDKAAKLPERKRQIEFIGDSFTVGYGNTSSSRECTNEELFNTTNSQLAFGPLTAKHFNADYQINASSGFGIVRNYNGHSPDKNLIGLYPFTLHNNHYIYASNWQPQVIVIGLGTNDFSTKLNDGERWKTREELQQDYVKKYTQLVKTLHTKNPKAHFILMASDKMEGELAAQVGNVVATLKADGLKKVDSIIFSGLDYQGCHWHPSAKDDKLLADLLIDYLSKNKAW